MRVNRMKRKWIMIGLGGMFIGIGINLFILPSHIINGGVFGISLLLKYLLGFKVGIGIVCINIPIYLSALKHNRSYFYNSLFGLTITSLAIDLLFPLNGIFDLAVFISALLGGLTIGLGVGIMLRHNTCPGGIDLLAFLLSKWTSVNIGFLLLLIDTSIVLIGLCIVGDKTLIYSLITVGGVSVTAGILTSFRSVIYLR